MKKPFEIVLHDEAILVLNKIAKVLIQPSPKGEKHTLTSLLKDHLKEPMFPCHRLDRETTGLIIYAKTKHAQEAIMNQFRARTIQKTYYALIQGRLRPKRGAWQELVLDREAKKYGERPKQAKTRYTVRKETTNWSLVELTPLTGRTNQLRIQLAQRGTPILGERKYAFARDFTVKFKRLALHAASITFRHPVSNDRISLQIPLPADMKAFSEQE